MFRNLKELSDLITSVTKTLTNVAKAGEFQSELLRETSEHDVNKKRHQFNREMAEWKAELNRDNDSIFTGHDIEEDED